MMIHFIRQGDTLQKIADEIKLENPFYLKEFHNQCCVKEDFIDDELVSGKKLFLPDFRKIQAYNSKNDAPFKSQIRNPKINFHPENLNINYKVSVRESSLVDEKKTENSFSYRFSLRWLNREFGNHIFHLSKNNFSIQNQTKIGDMAIACFQSIDPIEIQTNSKGEIISIKLFEETVKKFPEIKAGLLDQFPDQYAKIYIEEFEYAVLNQELFQKKMQEDWIIRTYFAQIRNDFKYGKSQFHLSLDNELLKVDQTVRISTNDDEIILNQEVENANFKGEYTVSKESGLINSLDITYSSVEYGILYSTDFKVNII